MTRTKYNNTSLVNSVFLCIDMSDTTYNKRLIYYHLFNVLRLALCIKRFHFRGTPPLQIEHFN